MIFGFGIWHALKMPENFLGPFSLSNFSEIGLLFDGLLLLLIALFAYLAYLDSVKPLIPIVIMCAISLIGFYILLNIYNFDFIYFLCQMSYGALSASVTLCWVDVLVRAKLKISVAAILGAFAIQGICTVIFNAINLYDKSFIYILALVLSISLLLLSLKSASQNAKEPSVTYSSMSVSAKRFNRLIIGVFAISTLYGFMLQADHLSGLVIQNSNQYVDNVLTGLIIILTAAISWTIISKNRWKISTDLIAPSAANALCLVFTLKISGPNLEFLGGIIFSVIVIFYYVLLWVALIPEAQERNYPAIFLIGLALGVARLSLLAGRMISVMVLENLAIDTTQIISLSLIFALTIVSVLYIHYMHQNINLENKLVPKDVLEDENVGIHTQYQIDSVQSILKSNYQLSDRELEVILPYSIGKSARIIADDLFLSEHTIKTHIRRSYAKLNVHSRQELQELLERF